MNRFVQKLKILGGSFKRLINFSIKINPNLAIKLYFNDWEKFLVQSKESQFKVYKKQHIIIEKYLIDKGYDRIIKDTIDKQREIKVNNPQNLPIWICWWQGEENMPPIIKKCYNNIKKYAGKHPVHLITLRNVNEYITLPPSILEKFHAGKIKHAHLADLIRLKLIAKFGGLWIDSTVYLTSPIDEDLFYKSFYTIKNNPIDNKSVSQYRWCSFFIGGLPHNPYISAIEKAFETYIIKEKIFLHYLIIDYLIDIMYNNNNNFHQIIDNLKITNPYMHWIGLHLNKKFSLKEFDTMNKNTTIYKTTYKGTLNETTKEGNITYYGYIINN